MAAELHFWPPEIPEPTLMENMLRHGLFYGAVLQFVCVLAIMLPVSKFPEAVSETERGPGNRKISADTAPSANENHEGQSTW
uniref:Protein MANBAL n=1 Tax=Coturnix japonica TaxID=93934 RepID=A0A8C2ST29_COTJA